MMRELSYWGGGYLGAAPFSEMQSPKKDRLIERCLTGEIYGEASIQIVQKVQFFKITFFPN